MDINGGDGEGRGSVGLVALSLVGGIHGSRGDGSDNGENTEGEFHDGGIMQRLGGKKREGWIGDGMRWGGGMRSTDEKTRRHGVGRVRGV